ncbi:hypothetical protein ACS3SW_03690 [Roseobacteraceae bacterium S113]
MSSAEALVLMFNSLAVGIPVRLHNTYTPDEGGTLWKNAGRVRRNCVHKRGNSKKNSANSGGFAASASFSPEIKNPHLSGIGWCCGEAREKSRPLHIA